MISDHFMVNISKIGMGTFFAFALYLFVSEILGQDDRCVGLQETSPERTSFMNSYCRSQYQWYSSRPNEDPDLPRFAYFKLSTLVFFGMGLLLVLGICIRQANTTDLVVRAELERKRFEDVEIRRFIKYLFENVRYQTVCVLTCFFEQTLLSVYLIIVLPFFISFLHSRLQYSSNFGNPAEWLSLPPSNRTEELAQEFPTVYNCKLFTNTNEDFICTSPLNNTRAYFHLAAFYICIGMICFAICQLAYLIYFVFYFCRMNKPFCYLKYPQRIRLHNIYKLTYEITFHDVVSYLKGYYRPSEKRDNISCEENS